MLRENTMSYQVLLFIVVSNLKNKQLRTSKTVYFKQLLNALPKHFLSYSGPLTCGIVNKSTLFHVVLGDTLQTTLSIMAIAPTGSLLSSDDVKKYVDNYYDLVPFDKITQAVSIFP